MSHVDAGRLNALLDGELSADEARAVETHVASCAECARRLEEARAFLGQSNDLLASLSPGESAKPAAPTAAAATRAENLGLAPLARGPAASESTRKSGGDRTSEPAVAKTSKEIAISLDGRTALTPAIRPVTQRAAPAIPAVPRKWNTPDLEKLAWAASLVLALGVGVLGNEVYRLRKAPPAQQVTLGPNQTPPQAQPAPVRGETTRGMHRTAATSGGARQSAGVPAHAPANAAARERADSRTASADTRAAKPRGGESKPVPAAVRRPTDALASAAGSGAASPAGAPAPSTLADANESRRTRAATDRALAPAPGAALGALEGRSAGPSAEPAPAFRRVTIDEAVRRLSGSIRLVEGMLPARVEAGPGRLVQGADPDRDVIRVTYVDPQGSRLVLDQQIGDVRTGSFNGLMQGDTLVTSTETGATRIRWVDRKFWLSLTGSAQADSLRTFVARVR